MMYLKYALGIIIRPGETVRNLIENPQRLKIGLFGVLTLGVLYSASCFIGYAQGIHPTGAWLKLPLDSYYLYEGIFMIPVAIASWVLMGCTIYFILPRTHLRFEDVLAIIGLPYGILVLPFMWLPEIIVTIFFPQLWGSDPVWLTIEPIRVALGTIWIYTICTLAIKELYRISWAKALAVTLIGIAVGGGFSGIFIR